MSQQETVVMETQQVVHPTSMSQKPMAGQQFFLPAQIHMNNGQTGIFRTVQAPSSGPKVWENYTSRESIWLGGTQIAVGLLLILLMIIGLEVCNIFRFGPGSGQATCCFIAGGFGVGAGKHKTTCMIVTTMVMSIMSACFALGAVVPVSASGIAFDRVFSYQHWQYNDIDTFKALHGGMLILALVEFVVAIVAFALCCAAVCCGKYAPQVTAFHYVPATMPPGQVRKTGGQLYPATQNIASYPMAATELEDGDLWKPQKKY